MNEQPLIHTSKGNLPVAELVYVHYWLEDDQSIVFVEEYTHHGEVVRRSVHKKMKLGFNLLESASA